MPTGDGGASHDELLALAVRQRDEPDTSAQHCFSLFVPLVVGKGVVDRLVVNQAVNLATFLIAQIGICKRGG